MEKVPIQTPTISEEASKDVLDMEKIHRKSGSSGGSADEAQLSPRSVAKPRRNRSATSTLSASLRSSAGSGGLMGLQLMSGSVNHLDLDDLPQESPRSRPQRREHSEAKMRLHSSMTALEGFTPEDLMEEVNRRRTERTRQNKLAMSMPASATGLRANMDPELSASMPAISVDRRSLTLRNSGANFGRTLEADLAMKESSESTLREKPTAAVIPTRENKSYIWQTPTCLGALELASELEFDYNAPLKPRYVAGREDFFTPCLEVWKEMKLADEFYQACKSVPQWTACCGLIRNDDMTMEETAKTLSKGWVKSVNQRLAADRKSFKIDVYIWSWHNATGKAKTNILLIRFLRVRK